MKRAHFLAKPAALAVLIAASLVTGCDPEAKVTAPTPTGTSTPLPTPTVPDVTPPVDGATARAAGEEAEVAPATKLRFERIVNDSRCPAGVQCIWAGEVRIGLVLTSPAGSDSLELSEHENKTTVHALQIEFLSFGACPASKPAAVLGKECATLKVTADAAK